MTSLGIPQRVLQQFAAKASLKMVTTKVAAEFKKEKEPKEPNDKNLEKQKAKWPGSLWECKNFAVAASPSAAYVARWFVPEVWDGRRVKRNLRKGMAD